MRTHMIQVKVILIILNNVNNLHPHSVLHDNMNTSPVSSGNRLQYLPPYLGQLPSLKHVELEGNPLTRPPKSICDQHQMDTIGQYMNSEIAWNGKEWIRTETVMAAYCSAVHKNVVLFRYC